MHAPCEELSSQGAFLFRRTFLLQAIRRLRTWPLRQLVLAIIVLGIVGLVAELLLIDHTESWTQWIPLVALFAGLASSIWVAVRPGPFSFQVFQAVMAIFVVSGLAGLYFHYAGNVEFAVERDSSLTGVRLAWKALRGATPALASGALAQLGLLGLAYTYTHPANRRTANGDTQ